VSNNQELEVEKLISARPGADAAGPGSDENDGRDA
jgi:hypothetical protein